MEDVDTSLLDSFERHLRARNRSPATITAYRNDAMAFARWLTEHTDVTDLAAVKGADVEGFLADSVSSGKAPATVARRYRSLLQLYKWMEREEEVAVSPMAKLRPPSVPVDPPPVITAADLRALLDACKGIGFTERRDTAMVLMLTTTGIRSAEIMGLEVADIDMKSGTFTVLGKGRRHRVVELLPKTAEALDRYLRARRLHDARNEPALWLGAKGPLTDSGLRQLLERRCLAAGIKPINPHRFRHTFAHEAKKIGMSDGDLMNVAGWQSPQMLQRYGASAAAERARESHRKLFEGREP